MAAQQILATMMSDAALSPGMLFIDEPGHPQVHEEYEELAKQKLVIAKVSVRQSAPG